MQPHAALEGEALHALVREGVGRSKDPRGRRQLQVHPRAARVPEREVRLVHIRYVVEEAVAHAQLRGAADDLERSEPVALIKR